MRPSTLVVVAGMLSMAVLPGICPAEPIVIVKEAGGGNPGENLLFRYDGLVSQGTAIQGATNQDHVVMTVISNSNEILTISGQGVVESISGDPPFQSLFSGVQFIPNSTDTFSNPELRNFDFFTDFLLNIDAAIDGAVTILAEGLSAIEGGAPISATANLTLDGSGQNYIRITAQNDAIITSVTVTAGGPDNISNISQIRVGGAGAFDSGPGPLPPSRSPAPPLLSNTPEPASLWVWALLGLVGIGHGLRQRLARRKRGGGEVASFGL